MTKRLARDARTKQENPTTAKKQAEQRKATQRNANSAGQGEIQYRLGSRAVHIHTRRKEPRSGRERNAHPWNSGVSYPTFFFGKPKTWVVDGVTN